MTTVNTLDSLRELMSDVFDVEPEDLPLTESTTAEDIEEWDSLSNVRLMVAIERRFHVRFTNGEIEAMRNVGDLVHQIDAKRA
jgi:acyl carrier protein